MCHPKGATRPNTSNYFLATNQLLYNFSGAVHVSLPSRGHTQEEEGTSFFVSHPIYSWNHTFRNDFWTHHRRGVNVPRFQESMFSKNFGAAYAYSSVCGVVGIPSSHRTDIHVSIEALGENCRGRQAYTAAAKNFKNHKSLRNDKSQTMTPRQRVVYSLASSPGERAKTLTKNK